MYAVREGRYQLLSANERGHYPIRALGVELGVWTGKYGRFDAPWLRWWDLQGNLLPTGAERAAEAERQNKLLRERLQNAGVDPDTI